jgi:hypothetical protein
MTNERVKQELALLRKYYPDLKFIDEGLWFKIPAYPLPTEKKWNRTSTDVAFQIQAAYPDTAPYGFYVPAGLLCDGTTPQNYQDRAGQQPPFGGQWGMFSWAHDDGQWKPTANIVNGPNLVNWVRGFADRFKQGA